MSLSAELEARLRCPASGARIVRRGDAFETVAEPARRYPLVDGIPVLIADEKSLFSTDDFVGHRDTTFDLHEHPLKKFVNGLVPGISANLKARENYAQLLGMLPARAKVLVIGGSIVGDGMEAFYANPDIEMVGSDVSFGPETDLVCDAHDIPFADGTFDCVIVQAVLEHVLDPERCVAEIHRVLRRDGLVYAETPFIQQVHMRQYDFTRFTHLGHRRLFRRFSELGSGLTAGPGVALAWSWKYFLRSLATGPWTSRLFNTLAHLTGFFLKYVDRWLIDRPAAYDAASGCYFLGRRSDEALSDRELVRQFRGVH